MEHSTCMQCSQHAPRLGTLLSGLTRTALEFDTRYAYSFTTNSKMLTAQLRLNASVSCAGVAVDVGHVAADAADLTESACSMSAVNPHHDAPTLHRSWPSTNQH